MQGAIAVYEQFPYYDCYNIDHLLKAHQLMMGQILTHAGHFRTQPVGVYGKEGVTHIAPPANMVSGLMAELFDWLQQSAEHPLIIGNLCFKLYLWKV